MARRGPAATGPPVKSLPARRRRRRWRDRLQYAMVSSAADKAKSDHAFIL
jgi:hypothetical protein